VGFHDQAHQWAERGAYLFAGVAVVSLQQAAFAVTIVAGLISAILGAIKLHDRVRYGRATKE
jgi:phage terminase Nu1 subunit (DNA packaging protein)